MPADHRTQLVAQCEAVRLAVLVGQSVVAVTVRAGAAEAGRTVALAITAMRSFGSSQGESAARFLVSFQPAKDLDLLAKVRIIP
ncbi:hypothetical protein, partial [Xanthomonas vasicola]|uniref:hypothetical protein n=1 Tax=Xanthomonas vasicola TaxID=56459 RepID=UPI0019672DC0